MLYLIEPNSKLVISCHHANVNDEGHTSQRLETDLMKQVFAESLKMDNGEPVIIESMNIDGDSKGYKKAPHHAPAPRANFGGVGSF